DSFTISTRRKSENGCNRRTSLNDRRRRLHEGRFPKINRLEVFSSDKVRAPERQLRNMPGARKQQPPAGKPAGGLRPSEHRALRRVLPNGLECGQVQRLGQAGTAGVYVVFSE